MPRLAANLAYLFTERRSWSASRAAAAAGFTAVELQFPYDRAAERGAGRDRTAWPDHARPQHARRAGRGRRVRAGRVPGPRGGIRDPVPAGARLRRRDRRCGRSTCWPARSHPSSGRPRRRSSSRNLRRAADLAAEKNITLLIEPINPRDRPDYFLNRVEHAADIIAKVGAPERPHPVRFLSCADRRRRSHHAGSRRICR